MDEKLLSIYVPTYNRADKVVKQLQFLINEIKAIDIKKIEIIVNNNCSTDNTEERVLNVIAGTPIIYHKNERNLGIVGNAYAAIEFISGKYFWLISDDDFLQEGIVERVINLLEMNPQLSYLFLNYSESEKPDKGLYNGPDGLTHDAKSMLLTNKHINIWTLGFATSCICITECLQQTINNLPLTEDICYGWTSYLSFASLHRGDSFFDTHIWIVSNASNVSWGDIAYQVYMGVVRMLSKLNLVGYQKEEIRIIYRQWMEKTQIIDNALLWNLWHTKNLRQFICDYFFCFKKAPEYIIKQSIKLLIRLIKKIKNGKIT